MYNHNVLSML